jgi:hypothetical protein
MNKIKLCLLFSIYYLHSSSFFTNKGLHNSKHIIPFIGPRIQLCEDSNKEVSWKKEYFDNYFKEVEMHDCESLISYIPKDIPLDRAIDIVKFIKNFTVGPFKSVHIPRYMDFDEINTTLIDSDESKLILTMSEYHSLNKEIQDLLKQISD